MEMEAEESLAMGLAKGKRTKRRLRQDSVTGVTSSCSSGGASLSSMTSLEGTDQEEEDMANCLILLAQGKGGGGGGGGGHRGSISISSSGLNTKMAELYVYECKTCNRTFPSFQALGGHRASHKKPRVTPTATPPHHEEELSNYYKCDDSEFEEQKRIRHVPVVALQLGCGGGSNKANKVHECSICGSEFTSGQALGGHMRRHRASNSNATNVQSTTFQHVKPRNVLELDLNLPAPPEDDLREAMFQFPATPNPLVLSPAPPLVGCHY